MRIASIRSSLLISLLALGCHATAPEASAPIDDSPTGRLVTGKRISTGEQRQSVGSLPMNMIATPDGRWVLTTDMGYSESIWVLGANDGHGVSHAAFPNAGRPKKNSLNGQATTRATASSSPSANGLYYGLAASPDGTIYAAQGAHDSIAVLSLSSEGKLTPQREIPTRRYDFPAGLALDQRGLLFVANNTYGGENPHRSPGSVAIYDPAGDGKEIGRCPLPDRYHGESGFPLAICVLHSGAKAYVDSERDGVAYVIDATDPAHPTVRATIETGSEPVGMTLSRDDRLLYVANARSETVSIIDTASDAVIGTILLRPEQARGLRGATPVAVALAPDQKTLYVALADMNAVAAVNVANPRAPVLQGYLPTGWYPSALAATPDGKHLLVADAKGSQAMHPNGNMPRGKSSYILDLLEGDVRSIELPDDDDDLPRSTRQVLAQNSLPAPVRPSDEHVAQMGLKAGRIQHVFYIIKENRTYDQVLGDLPQGNGDKSLTIFGRDITPNLHAIAERFVLLDNLFCSGEVSGDGWCWSTQGMANPFVVRNVPYGYSGRGRKFDYEGQNNGFPTGGVVKVAPGAEPATNPVYSQGGEPIPDVASAGDHLWDAAKRAGVSVRNYGFYFFSENLVTGKLGGRDNYPAAPGLQPGGHDLAGISDIDFRQFDLDFADSQAPQILFEKTGNRDCLYPKKDFGQAKSNSRFGEWKREFDLMLKKDPTGAAVPGLSLIRFSDDHTAGMRSGGHSPKSMVADNDFAVGEFIETLSRSPIWKSSAVFIIEDDAQAGEDHVDAHRTTCYAISPWIKRGSVDHRFYNTDSVLKTMELLLGISPMTQYEAIAAAIDDFDSAPANAEPFEAIMPSEKLIGDVVPPAKKLSASDGRRRLIELSNQMDFRRADAAPTPLLNEVVWKSVRGVESVPPPRRVSNTLAPGKDDDDDDGK